MDDVWGAHKYNGEPRPLRTTESKYISKFLNRDPNQEYHEYLNKHIHYCKHFLLNCNVVHVRKKWLWLHMKLFFLFQNLSIYDNECRIVHSSSPFDPYVRVCVIQIMTYYWWRWLNGSPHVRHQALSRPRRIYYQNNPMKYYWKSSQNQIGHKNKSNFISGYF